MDMKKIGGKIADARKCHGYTQETLAEKLGMSPQAVSKWETGAGLPEASTLVELSALFGISVDVLLQCGPRDTIGDFMTRNLAAPCEMLLCNIPRISRWNPPEGCDMFYSAAAMLAAALCAVEARERGSSDPVSYVDINARFRELLHLMGFGYTFLWEDDRHVIEELWRINDYGDMARRVMRYYGRDFLWIDAGTASPDELRRVLVWSVSHGNPVVMEWAGGIPEYSVVTGYKDGGDTLIGFTYCEECAASTNEFGMFVNPARWGEVLDCRLLIIGDRCEATYTDRESITFALEMLDKTGAVHKDYTKFKFTAGDAALHRWLDECDTPEHAAQLFGCRDMFSYALYMNTIYTQKQLLADYKKLALMGNRAVNDAVVQITIAVGILENDRNQLDELKTKPEEYLTAAQRHIGNILKYRQSLCGWLETIYENL